MNVTNVFFLEIWFLNLYTQQTIIMQTLMLKLFLFLEIPEIIFFNIQNEITPNDFVSSLTIPGQLFIMPKIIAYKY